MAEFHIPEQHAQGNIYNAETINIGDGPQDHRAAGRAALTARLYPEAVRHLRQLAEQGAATADDYYYLGLAGLAGVHPGRLDSQRVTGVMRRFVRAVELDARCHHAKIAAIVVNDGLLERGGRISRSIAPDTRRSLSALDPAHAAEIREHVPVPASPVWQAVAQR
ncbi:hypothetical protein AB0M28_02050 [Streptomyces sp. NPDC051940]|uniref:hypothetical protein n=1 Tax=Streptomyces sp. NPDC051940 TaxID=3155675 RepID=UPI00341A911B